MVFAPSGRLQELLSPAPDENELNNAVTEPVCNFYPTAEGLDHAEGVEKIPRNNGRISNRGKSLARIAAKKTWRGLRIKKRAGLSKPRPKEEKH
jgi:hypothetical protein